MFMHSAMMEWHTDRQTQVPRNILELCMKGAHIGQPGFVRAYAQFLATTGDVANARAVFERALAQPAVPLGTWDAYLEVGHAAPRRPASLPGCQEEGWLAAPALVGPVKAEPPRLQT